MGEQDKTEIDGLPEVGGRRLECSLAEFERRCRVLIMEEQQKAWAENHVVGVLSDAVRLCREHFDYVKCKTRDSEKGKGIGMNLYDPIFPIKIKIPHEHGHATHFFPGLSKREYLAGLAMQGILNSVPRDAYDEKQVARDSVAYADALLVEMAQVEGK